MAGATGSLLGNFQRMIRIKLSKKSYFIAAGGIFILLLAGWLGQKYGLPPPPPKIAGIDLGTTYSSIGEIFGKKNRFKKI